MDFDTTLSDSMDLAFIRPTPEEGIIRKDSLHWKTAFSIFYTPV